MSIRRAFDHSTANGVLSNFVCELTTEKILKSDETLERFGESVVTDGVYGEDFGKEVIIFEVDGECVQRQFVADLQLGAGIEAGHEILPKGDGGEGPEQQDRK